MKKNTMQFMKAAVSTLLLLSVTALSFVACEPSQPTDPTPSVSPTGSPDTTPTPTEAPISPVLLVDQTGHPEVSAEKVDLKAMLAVDPSYNYVEDYKIRFTPAAAVDPDAETYPHAIFHETIAQNGIKVGIVTDEPLRFLNVKERDCWLFEHLRNQTTNQLRISLDAATAAKFEGKSFSLHFSTYVSQAATFTLQYKTASGEEKTVKSTSTRLNEWCEVVLDLEAPALNGTYDDYDFYLTMTGPEYIRINTIWITEVSKNMDRKTGLIPSTHGESFYTVADVNVLDCGAVGDGLHDDTAAFKTAIDKVSKMGGGTVFVPAGYYCLTEKLVLPSSVGIIGELETGTVNGTVLMIYHGKGTTSGDKAAITLNHQACVMNVAFWYPEQTIVNGTAIPYPATIMQVGSESVTVRNVTFVNSYVAIDYAHGGSNNSLQYTRDIYGTALKTGYENDHSYDIGKIENFNLSADVWLNSGFPGTPNAELLREYLLQNATGLILERIDWTYLADVTITGYNKGVYITDSGDGTSNGHMYNFNLLECQYGIYCDALNWMMITNSTFTSSYDSDSAGIYTKHGCGGQLSLNNCKFTCESDYAVVNEGSTNISFTDSVLTAAKEAAFNNVSGTTFTAINTTLSNKVDGGLFYKENATPTLENVPDYSKTVVTKPASEVFVNLQEAPYNAKKNTDITEILQKALDDMKSTGGTLYLGAGTFFVSKSITVWAGIELRGCVCWPQSFGATQIQTSFGLDNPNGEALINLCEGAGIRGVGFVYQGQNDTKNLHETSFTIRGNGANIYLVDVAMTTAWNGVDFATNRCDNHYVEYLWGTPMNITIQVGGGSENGIIRDCHLTPNCWATRATSSWWNDVYFTHIMTHGTPFVVGDSKNEILYHNFTYGAFEGLTLKGEATNVFSLCHGVDAATHSSAFYDNASGLLVDTQLVNINSGDMHYVQTDKSFLGDITMINAAFWGASTGAFKLCGEGDFELYGGFVYSAGRPLIEQKGGNATFRGVYFDDDTRFIVDLSNFAESITLSGNYYSRGFNINNAVNASEYGDDFSLYLK